MKKITVFMMSLLLMWVTPATFVSAKEAKEPLTLDFGFITVELDEYETDDVIAEYSEEIDEKICTLYDPETNTVLETIRVANMYSLNSATDSTVFLKRDKNVGGVTLRLTASVQVYSSGSFRQINSLNYVNLTILTGISQVEIENYSASCNPYSGSYPDWRMNYSYTCTLRATVSETEGEELVLELEGLGYSVSHQTTTNTYMRQYVNSSGTISIY